MTRYSARSASDRTDHWPFWMVWNGSVNVTGRVAEALGLPGPAGAVFAGADMAKHLADKANQEGLTI